MADDGLELPMNSSTRRKDLHLVPSHTKYRMASFERALA
jgi:hypothetical protein